MRRKFGRGGAYFREGLFLEGLIIGILRYIKRARPGDWEYPRIFFTLEGMSIDCQSIKFAFALVLRYDCVIGLKNARHFLNQSEVKPRPIVTCLHAFPALEAI